VIATRMVQKDEGTNKATHIRKSVECRNFELNWYPKARVRK